jgi:hypothetical protein
MIKIIKLISIRTIIISSSLITAFAIYIIVCAIYPEELIGLYVFVINNWVGFEILFLVIFIYIIYAILRINFIYNDENNGLNWFFAFIMIIIWLILIFLVVDYSKIRDLISI